MLRGTVVPRFPWGVPPETLAPQISFVLPPIGFGLEGRHGPVMACWAALFVHLSALRDLYLANGPNRISSRLGEQASVTRAMLYPTVGPRAVAMLSESAKISVQVVLSELGPQVSSREAGWWAVAVQASFALAAWFGLHPETLPDADQTMGLNKSLRAGVETLFGEALADRLLTAATGDGAGDMLRLVALIQLGLESSVHHDLTAHEPVE